MVQVVSPLFDETDNVQGIVDGFVAVELGLDISVTQDTELWRQVGAVGSEDLTVEGQWWD